MIKSIFLDCEQTNSYFNIIETSKLDVQLQSCKGGKKHSCPNDYCETHHILPKSVGKYLGIAKQEINDKQNLVRLSAKNHFIVHLLLKDMFPANSQCWFKMACALQRMSVSKKQNQYEITPESYELIKKHFSDTTSIRVRDSVSSGTHNFLGGEIQRASNLARTKRGINPMQNYWDDKSPERRSEISKIRSEKSKINRTANFNGRDAHREFASLGAKKFWSQFDEHDLSKEQTRRIQKGLQDPQVLARFQQNMIRANHIRWAKYRKENNKPPKPGDIELLAELDMKESS